MEGLIAGRTAQRDSTLAGLTARKPQVLADYGYTATGYDETGAPTGLTFDPNNPFSKAALLKKNYDQQQAGTQNSMAARGQLYAGSLRNQTASNEFGYQGNNDALVKALTAALVGLAGQERSARTTYDTDVAGYRAGRAPAS